MLIGTTFPPYPKSKSKPGNKASRALKEAELNSLNLIWPGIFLNIKCTIFLFPIFPLKEMEIEVLDIHLTS